MASATLFYTFIFLFLLRYCCRASIIHRSSDLQFTRNRRNAAECGLTQDSKIVRGVISKPKTWHWMAALVYNDGSNFCGGSLISRKHILTAAHCLEDENLGSFRVRLGAHKFEASIEPDARDYEVKSFKMHPSYERLNHFKNDIALITLKEEAQAPTSLLPICLPQPKPGTFFGKHGTIIGWGSTENGHSSKVLLQASLPIWNNTDCSTALSIQFNETVVCAGYREGGTDTCQGDSGGPLMVTGEHNKWMVAGIVSWGFSCGLPNKPGVYTRVGPYLDWIDEILSPPDLVPPQSPIPPEHINPRCGPVKLPIGIMLDAIKKAVNDVKVRLADNRFKALEYVNMAGNRVWASGICSDGSTRERCDTCISQLVDEIWGDCDNAQEAESWTPDCGLRYASRRLSLPDRFPSSNGDTSLESASEAGVKRCSPVKLPIGIMLDAAKRALHDVKVRLADNLFKTLAYVNIQGNQVWAMGMCANTNNRHLCDKCITKLAQEIWGDCDNAKGAELWTRNCGIQYAFQQLVLPDHFLIPSGLEQRITIASGS